MGGQERSKLCLLLQQTREQQRHVHQAIDVVNLKQSRDRTEPVKKTTEEYKVARPVVATAESASHTPLKEVPPRYSSALHSCLLETASPVTHSTLERVERLTYPSGSHDLEITVFVPVLSKPIPTPANCFPIPHCPRPL